MSNAEAAGAPAPLTPPGADLLMVRTHQADPQSLRIFDHFAQHSGLDVVFGCDEREGEVDTGGRPKFGFTDETVRMAGLYLHPNAGWRCGDYFHYFGRSAQPGHERYWLIEPDVWINVADLAGWFAEMGRRDADLLVAKYGPRPPEWGWWGTVSKRYDPVVGCVFPVTRLTGRAIDHLFQARRAASTTSDAALRAWPNDEAFVSNELTTAGFKCEDLNPPGLTLYTMKSFRNGSPHDAAALMAAEPDGLIYHPARDFGAWIEQVDTWMGKLKYPPKRHEASRLAGAADALLASPGLTDAAVIPLLAARSGWMHRRWAKNLAHIESEADQKKTRAAEAKFNRVFAPRAGRPPAGTLHVIESVNVSAQRTLLARPLDFQLLEGTVVGQFPREFALPYCWDLETRELLLTLHLRPQLVLEDPFLYAAQRKRAQVLARLTLKQLDAAYGVPDPEAAPLLIFSVGRTGSTLLDSLVRCVTPRAVSEPDTLTQLAAENDAFQALEPRVRKAMLWHSISAFYATRLDTPGPAPLSIKLRSQANGLSRDLIKAFPKARCVFMLRGRRDWAKSTLRAFGMKPERAAGRLAQGIKTLSRMRATEADVTVLWYEEVVADPHAAVSRILDQTLTPQMAGRITAVMGRDSQAGTGVARDRTSVDVEGEAAWLESFEAAWAMQRPGGLLKQMGLDL